MDSTWTDETKIRMNDTFDNAVLRAENALYRKENAALKVENAELRAMLAKQKRKL